MKLKNLIAIFSAFLMAIVLSVTAFASSGVSQCNRFWIDGDYTGHIQFIPAHVIESGEKFSLVKGKQVRQSYLTCQRTNIIGEVTYNSGRLYSSSANSKAYTFIFNKDASIVNTLLQTEKINYGWIYF